MPTKMQAKKADKRSADPPESLVIGAKEIEGLPGHFSTKVVKLIERNAFAMVEHAVEKANAGDYRAMKYLFDLLERFESLVPERRGSSMAKVLLKHLGLTEEMIANEQAAAEAEEENGPFQEAEGKRVE